LILFENLYARPQDEFLTNCRSRISSHESDVYHVGYSNDPDDFLIMTWRESATAIQTSTMVFAISEEDHPTFLPGGSLKHMDLLASKCIGIVVSAYDGEGFVIWRRKKGHCTLSFG
jgi:hypothetical protein